MITKIIEQYTLKLLFPADIHALFTDMHKEEIMYLFGYVKDEEYEKLERMHKEGMTTYRYSMAMGIVQNEKGETIDNTGYHIWNKDHRNAEIYYNLNNNAYKRKGIMSLIVPEVLKIGFEEMNLKRIQARVARWNEPSLKLLAKLGFKEEGTLMQDYFYDGEFNDSICFSLINSEGETN